jgi:hypothetical protein
MCKQQDIRSKSVFVEKGELRTEPFDKSADNKAMLSDLSGEKIDWFVNLAKSDFSLHQR